MITIRNAKIRKHSSLLRAMIGGPLTSLFLLAACAQMAHAASAEQAIKAYVGNFKANTVSVIDAAAGKVVATVPVAAGPRGMVLSPDGSTVYVQRIAATTVEGGAKVSIANFAFTPAEVSIAPGESVTWTNDDGAPHGLEFHDGAKGTDLLLPGMSFTRRFDQPGAYDYNCTVHPYMTGRVVVRGQ